LGKVSPLVGREFPPPLLEGAFSLISLLFFKTSPPPLPFQRVERGSFPLLYSKKVKEKILFGLSFRGFPGLSLLGVFFS